MGGFKHMDFAYSRPFFVYCHFFRSQKILSYFFKRREMEEI